MSQRHSGRVQLLPITISKASRNKAVLVALVSLVVATAGIASAAAVGTNAGSPHGYVTSIVHKGNITESVTASGTIEPMAQVPLSFGAAGMVSTLNVQPGQRVMAGQVLAELSLSAAKARLLQAENLLLSDQARLALDMAGPTPETLQSDQAAIAVAQNNLAAAQQDLSSTQVSNTAALAQIQTVSNQAEIALEIDQSALLVDQQRFATAQALAAPRLPATTAPVPIQPLAGDYGLAASQSLVSADQSYITADQEVLAAADSLAGTCASQACSSLAQLWTSQDSGAVLRARDAVSRAGSVIEDLQAVSNDENQLLEVKAHNTLELDSADQAVKAAEVKLSNAKSAASTSEQPPAPTLIAADTAAVTAAEHALAAAQQLLAQSQIIAPAGGIVSEINIFVGQQMTLSASTAGDIVLEGNGPFEASALVSENSIGQVKIGQQAAVTPVGHSRSLSGTVNEITPMATLERGVPGFQVSVLINATHRRLFAGISAEVRITTAHRRNVLLVPTSCVHTNGASSYVKLLQDGRSVTTPVKLGLSSGIYTQISSGVREGAAVILANLNNPLPSTASLPKARKALGQAGVPKGPRISPEAKARVKR